MVIHARGGFKAELLKNLYYNLAVVTENISNSDITDSSVNESIP